MKNISFLLGVSSSILVLSNRLFIDFKFIVLNLIFLNLIVLVN